MYFVNCQFVLRYSRVVAQVLLPLMCLLHLFSICSVLVQYLFSRTLNKYWTSTKHKKEKPMNYYVVFCLLRYLLYICASRND